MIVFLCLRVVVGVCRGQRTAVSAILRSKAGLTGQHTKGSGSPLPAQQHGNRSVCHHAQL